MARYMIFSLETLKQYCDELIIKLDGVEIDPENLSKAKELINQFEDQYQEKVKNQVVGRKTV